MRKKILPLSELAGIRNELRREGVTFVLTNGCFDILHVGHVRYLNKARRLGDRLAVAINTDESVRSLKGPKRPIMPEDERAEIVAALEAVDFVVLFSDATAESVVAALKPDVYVKGGDYSASEPAPGSKQLPEAHLVRSYGGVIQILPLVPDHSTTDVVRAVLEKEAL